jgi:hypothetical protein
VTVHDAQSLRIKHVTLVKLEFLACQLQAVERVFLAVLEPLLVAGQLYIPTRLVSVDASMDNGLW